MLTRLILDPAGQESPTERTEGLGLLPVEVTFDADKTLAIPSGSWRGIEVGGYEIHHGRMDVDLSAGEPFLDGVRVGSVWGTMWHGAFECDDFRRAWLAEAAEHAGSAWRPVEGAIGYGQRREQMIDVLADAVEEHLGLDRLFSLAGGS